jgi:predicted acyl esterase
MRRRFWWLGIPVLALLVWRSLAGRRADGLLPGERPGWRYAARRLLGLVAPPVTVLPPPSGIRFDRDVPVTLHDGTVLRVNVFRPEAEGRYPVLLSGHPYGKDKLPKRGVFGYQPNFQFRILRQPKRVTLSAWTTWEAPDPAFWVPLGYAVVNCDLRGFGTSDGRGSLLSDQEAGDIYDLIEWAAVQPWSSGRVGMNGVSYLALSQYRAAALRPPHLAAICPWEGFSDAYADFAYPGGIREDGFIKLWSGQVRRSGRVVEDIRAGQMAHPLRDGWWTARTPDLQRIETPMLVCGSFSDHLLHSGGSFRAFEQAASPQRWLYTHRGGKWATYYSEESRSFQRRFFDHFLKGEENGMLDVPPVRLEVREDRDTIHAVRAEAAWPLSQTRWTDLYLDASGRLATKPGSEGGSVRFNLRTGRATFDWEIPEDMEIAGPMALHLFVALEGATDASLFAGVQKLRRGRVVPFEGSYGYGYDRVSTGWLRVALRKLDVERSSPWQPAHCYDELQPVGAGEIAPVAIELMPSATFFRRGEQLRLLVQGRWFSNRNPFLGQFPAAYERGPSGTCVLYCGGAYDARLIVPVIP